MTADAGKVADAIDALAARLLKEASTRKLTVKEQLILRLNEQYPKVSREYVSALSAVPPVSHGLVPMLATILQKLLCCSLVAQYRLESLAGAQDVGVLSAYFLNLIALDQGQVRHTAVLRVLRLPVSCTRRPQPCSGASDCAD